MSNGENQHTLEYVLPLEEEEEEESGAVPGDEPPVQEKPKSKQPAKRVVEIWVFSIFYIGIDPDDGENDEEDREDIERLKKPHTWKPSASLGTGSVPQFPGASRPKVKSVKPPQESGEEPQKAGASQDPIRIQWDFTYELAEVVYVIHHVIFIVWSPAGLRRAVDQIRTERGRAGGNSEVNFIWMGHTREARGADLKGLLEIVKSLGEVTAIAWICSGSNIGNAAGFDLFSSGSLYYIGSGALHESFAMFVEWLALFGAADAFAGYNQYVFEWLRDRTGEESPIGLAGRGQGSNDPPGRLGRADPPRGARRTPEYRGPTRYRPPPR